MRKSVCIQMYTDMQVPVNGEPPKEVEDLVREDVAVAIASICRSDAAREAFLSVGADTALRKGYEFEEHKGTCEAMEAAARLFLGVQAEDDSAAPAGLVFTG
jgi:ABC-type sulfate transport system substrate-binding protein